MQKVQIYTDGACSGNPGAGGWAAKLLVGADFKEISGFEPDTTNNRMELLAAIRGLEALKSTAVAVELYSDSAYLVNAVQNGWIANWQRNGWRTADKKDVKNRDLWERLIALNTKYSPKYIKVKGHSDNPHNNRCDEMAVAEIKKHKN
jgi:ribonuclease HI